MGTLAGRVIDANGDPIDGASIEVVGTDLDGMPVSETPRLLMYKQTNFRWALAGPAPLIPAGELGVMPGPIPPIPRENGPIAPTVVGAPDGGVEQSAEEFTPWVNARRRNVRGQPGNARAGSRPGAPPRLRRGAQRCGDARARAGVSKSRS